MKTWIMSALCAGMMITAPAFAADAPVIAQVTGRINQTVQNVYLLADGNAKVVMNDSQHTVVVKRISAQNFSQLQWLARSLANAELKTSHHLVVCMMMPYNIESLSVTDGNGREKLILSPRGCWVADQTYPAQDWQLAQAEQLEQSLVVIANEIAKN